MLVKRKVRQTGKRAVKRKQLQLEQQLLTISYRGLGSGSDHYTLLSESKRKVKVRRERKLLVVLGNNKKSRQILFK